MRDYLRSLPVFAGVIGSFDPDTVPGDPADLFSVWLHEAVDDGVVEPHAMTLSTVDAAGHPDARTLILKDLGDDQWWFATNANSAKGIQLTDCPVAALTFYWPTVARQIRVRGSVVPGPPELSTSDFRARGPGAKAVTMVSRESQPLSDRAACARAVAEAENCLAAHPDFVSPTWCVYALLAQTVEFWQADKDRQHIRLQYQRTHDAWTHTLLWP
ncbi:MAG: pyridoxamine 5-phosphate oxidase [Mycobacterium sp.]|jgi:pyridoxamine 5'-phosphate oxidase|nr:pyridoxamine 5-phosphate oxidase [Mycobacterium sp.]